MPIRAWYSGSAAHPRPIVAFLGVEHAQRDVLASQNRMLARNALVLLLATVPATATATENDSQSADGIMPGCNAWLAQLSRGSTALGSNVFLAGECMGIVGTVLYFSRDFSFSSAACPPANVTYNQAIQIVTAYISARPQRIQERFIDLATEALHDAWPCKPNLK